MKIAKIVGIVLLAYAALVVIFESLLGYFQPEAGDTLVITTFDADGTGHDRVLSALDGDEQLYVAVNHWPRAWYRRALRNPAVAIRRGDETRNYTAVPLTGEERSEVADAFPIPIVARTLMGFAPRRFLRLDPQEASASVDVDSDQPAADEGSG